PTPDAQTLVPVGGVGDLELAVLGDRVVEGDDRRQQLLEAEHPVAEALVVVDEIEVADPRLELLQGAHAEGQRLAEGARDVLADLDRVGPALDLPEAGEA